MRWSTTRWWIPEWWRRPAGAELHYAGKRAGSHALSQDEINALLVELGGRCECVVRLKGGDPFIFGRGGEEALALRAAGLEFEVVPGVSSAHAVPAYAGIPVTHRGLAAQVTVVTGHEDPNRPESSIDWTGLAATPGTLVFLMGVRSLGRIAERLIEAASRPPHLPRSSRRGRCPPSAPCRTAGGDCRSRSRLACPGDHRGGGGCRVARPDRLVRAPAAVWPPDRSHPRPRPGLEPGRGSDRVGGGRGRGAGDSDRDDRHPPFDPAGFDIICLTSANGVEQLLAGDVRRLAGVKVAVVGRATAEAARARGIEPDVVPKAATQEGLEEALGDVPGARVLVATAEGARTVLADSLRAGGAEVSEVALYRSVAEPVDAAAVMSCDWVTFTASSTVTNVLGGLAPEERARLQAISIGPITSDTLRRAASSP